MDKVVTVAVREFLEMIRTKAFIISVIIMPALLMAFIFGAQWIAQVTEPRSCRRGRSRWSTRPGCSPGAADRDREAQRNGGQRQAPVRADRKAADADLAALAAAVSRGELYAYLVIPPQVLTGEAPASLPGRTSSSRPGPSSKKWSTEPYSSVRARSMCRRSTRRT